MASSSNPGSSHTNPSSSNYVTNASIVIVSPCTSGFPYSLSTITVVFSRPITSWVSDHNVVPKPRFAKFPTQDAADDIEPKTFGSASSFAPGHLSEFRMLYNIPLDHELILPEHHKRATTLWVLFDVQVALKVRDSIFLLLLPIFFIFKT